ncbi:uncharacterized protein YdaT [Flavobacterium sp. W4I14]|nr:uncharacterized protein YdaT [Flavobacterium sp. W4I14]
MPWYNGDFPPSYKNQSQPLREKAVEIANALLTEGVEEGIAIATGLKRARQYFGESEKVESDLKDIASDKDTLEPEDFGVTEGTIDISDPKQLSYWAEQFQISTEELKAVVAIRGQNLSEIKNYLKS